jgi:hypothetical protein
MNMVVLLAITIALSLLLFVDSRSARTWIADHKYPLLIWRLGVYAITARVWWKLRLRIVSREGSDPVSADPLRRAEIAALLSIVLIEAINWLPQLGSLGIENK